MPTAVCVDCGLQWTWRARKGTRLGLLSCSECGGALRRFDIDAEPVQLRFPLGTDRPARLRELREALHAPAARRQEVARRTLETMRAASMTEEGIRELDGVAGSPVCRECGCTLNSPCAEGCWWVEADLCSASEGAAIGKVS